MVSGEAAAVVANVDDNAVFTGAVFVEVLFELFEFFPEHAGYVDVAELSFGELFYHYFVIGNLVSRD